MAQAHPGLQEYRRKRNFAGTPEPSGEQPVDTPDAEPSFVIQKHAARRLHYDFRLEMDGVLKSWAVPKGPPVQPGERRLAVETEDHPLDYGDFEGVIPEGHYGAGRVIVWDTGNWETTGSALKQYKAGKISFELHGRRLRGRWTLVRTRGRDASNWLLIKGHDQGTPEIVEPRPAEEEISVLSGRSLADMATAPGKPAAGESGKSSRKKTSGTAANWKAAIPTRARKAVPSQMQPQIPKLVKNVPTGDKWLHEIKLDGYRVLAEKRGDKVTIYTRNGNDWTAKFAEIAARVAQLPCAECVVDGEVVVYNSDGTTDFQSLQNAIKANQQARKHLVAFDLLHLDGYDLRTLTTVERKGLLAELLSRHTEAGADPGDLLQSSDGIIGHGDTVMKNACEMGLEGIVSKRVDARYRAGKQDSWVKTKCINSDEFVIGGYTEPQGERQHFGALLLGYHDGKKLIYCGKVGTGFSQASLDEMGARLRSLERKTSPFSGAVPDEGQPLHWVRPELVAQIHYSAWTRDGRLRHPSFQGLREDKPAVQVDRESPADTAAMDAIIKEIRLTSPDKVLFSEQNLTKRDLARYYVDIAEWILPYVVNRPLSLVRCPSGARKTCFFQKHPKSTFREPVRTIRIKSEDYVYIDDIAGLISLVQYGVLEVHPWGSSVEDLDRPDTLTFDLDPGPGVEWTDIARSGRLIHNRLLTIGLKSFAKLSGSKGLHVVVPLTPAADWKTVKTFAQQFSRLLEAEDPDRFIATATKAKRTNRIFIDYLRNSKGATSVACYSTRARPAAPVAVPIRWDELSPRVRPDRYTVTNLRSRLSALKEDPWKDYFSTDQKLTADHLNQVKART